VEDRRRQQRHNYREHGEQIPRLDEKSGGAGWEGRPTGAFVVLVAALHLGRMMNFRSWQSWANSSARTGTQE